jgi:putative hydrolase of the HAD superfamily
MSSSSPKVVLFDLGGVLIEWPGIEGLVELSDGSLSHEEARRRWLASRWVREHETGACTAAQFARGVVAEFRLPVTPDVFLAHFNAWRRGPYPGALELLDELAPRYHLACLSNMSQSHWDGHLDDDDSNAMIGRLQQRFVSFEIGCMKPDRSAFDHVARHLPGSPEEIVFLDDNRECVETARALGFRAFEVKGVAAVRRALAEAGIEISGTSVSPEEADAAEIPFR